VKVKIFLPSSSVPDFPMITKRTGGVMTAKVGSSRLTVRELSVGWLRIVRGRAMFTSRLVHVLSQRLSEAMRISGSCCAWAN
jgi:hypothetical protein